jgi:hypothetical protein
VITVKGVTLSFIISFRKIAAAKNMVVFNEPDYEGTPLMTVPGTMDLTSYAPRTCGMDSRNLVKKHTLFCAGTGNRDMAFAQIRIFP